MNWWDRAGFPQEPAGPGQEAGPGTYQPPKEKLRTLGLLKHLEDPFFVYYEHHYLKNLQRFMTDKWWLLQGGSEGECLENWFMVLKLLELDNKAMRDLFLLAQAGLVGRAHANKVLWTVLSGPALDPDYPDMSNLVTSLVYKARKNFDRPPREHRDLSWWSWSCYTTLYKKDQKWSPINVPVTSSWQVVTGEGGKPLPPPACWGEHAGHGWQ